MLTSLPTDTLLAACREHPYPLVFATVSGAHLYGFPSPDSDYDLRGVHLLPLKEVVGLAVSNETVEVMTMRDGLELDLVTHDARKFFLMLLKRNGYVLEQLLSPLVVTTTDAHAELQALARGCITRHHAHHYLGFAETQWKRFENEQPHRIKPLLYTFRVLLTGLHLMRTGELVAHLPTLQATYGLSYLEELIARKQTGTEHGTLEAPELGHYRAEVERLRAALEQAHLESRLPDRPSAWGALDDLLIRLRTDGRA